MWPIYGRAVRSVVGTNYSSRNIVNFILTWRPNKNIRVSLILLFQILQQIEMLPLRHISERCWNSDTSESRLEVSWNFWNGCWRRMENISWPDRVKNVLPWIKGKRSTLHKINRRKADWIGRILRGNCLTKYVIEGKIEVEIERTRRQGRIRTQLLDNLKEMRIYRKLSGEARDSTVQKSPW